MQGPTTGMTGKGICRYLARLRDGGAGFDAPLSKAAELLHRSNPRFHLSGIHELFPDNVLRLGPLIGAPTDHVFIGVGKGVCGSAVAERRNMNVPDVPKAADCLARSAATRAEPVIPIRRVDRIHAQIEIDSHDLDAFDEDATAQAERVADWLAELYASR